MRFSKLFGKNDKLDRIYNPKAIVEAALFLGEGSVSQAELSDLTGLDREEISKLMREFKEELQEDHRGLRLMEDEKGYRLHVKQKYLDRVKHLAPHQDLSRGTLRTLSVIAYNNPVLQKEVIEVRGNGAYSHIDDLLERGFIESEKEGRTKLLSVTNKFLRYFEFESIKEMKDQF